MGPLGSRVLLGVFTLSMKTLALCVALCEAVERRWSQGVTSQLNKQARWLGTTRLFTPFSSMDGDDASAGGAASGDLLPTQQEAMFTNLDAPLREDQIQNAVAFLSHPKVQSRWIGP